MRLKLKPFSTLKALAASASVFTFCMAPVAQGAAAANQKQLINQFLKDTKITTKKQTVGEFWAGVRQVFPKKPQSQMDQWMRINGDQPMPSVEATTFKGADGKEQVRLNFLSKDGKTMTMTFTGDEERFVKINSVYLSAKDLQRYNNFDQIVAKLAKDPALKKSLEGPVVAGMSTPVKKNPARRILTGREIAKLKTTRAQAEYLLRLRLASEAADKVFTSGTGKKGAMNEILNQDAIQYVWSLLLPDANAAQGPCVASGWVAEYDKNSCAAAPMGREALNSRIAELPFSDKIKSDMQSCSEGGNLPCNPMIFGFKDNNGTPICIQRTSDRRALNSATSQCNKLAPIDSASAKEKIIQSIVAAKGKEASLCKLSGEKEVSQDCINSLEKYTDGLKDHYMNAANFCTANKVKDPTDRASWVTRTDLKKDQIDACENLKDRYFDLVTILDPKTGIATPPPVPADPCPQQTAGTYQDSNGQCVCQSTQKPPEKSEAVGPVKLTCPAAVIPGVGEPTDKAPEECTEWSWCKKKGLYIGAGIATAALIAWLLLKKKKKDKKDPVYETPVTVEPSVSPSPTATTPGTVIETPDPGPTTPTCEVPPNSVINGVCTPPTVVIPDPPPSEGGTTEGAPTSGGVR
ncbi:hypothetical protein [Bdellovibrio sp. KM01]|uniref:hypothetical protein n=1 Tax=Bdellovibrio sp. KM01 TaxID=2748865 RepID=UPI0015E9575F|nr:hypothetical protein [Bdellovibrio sp. KM01]QLY27174.1 hypothetical protein HW988_09400 [Bdellovibrio sp. KM01]